MALVNLTNINILNNPSLFKDPFSFEITFEVISEIKEDVEFKVIYVGSPNSSEFDQELESVFVGPVPVGTHQFVLEAEAPNPAKIPQSDIIGCTIVLISVFYKSKEFMRVGYFTNIEDEDAPLNEDGSVAAGHQINVEKLKRSILTSQPRISKFPISWDEPEKTIEAELLESGNMQEPEPENEDEQDEDEEDEDEEEAEDGELVDEELGEEDDDENEDLDEEGGENEVDDDGDVEMGSDDKIGRDNMGVDALEA